MKKLFVSNACSWVATMFVVTFFSAAAVRAQTAEVDSRYNGVALSPTSIQMLATTMDGKVLNSYSFNGVAFLRRFNVDGLEDAGANLPNSGGGGWLTLCALPDGKMLLGGNFTVVNGVPRFRLVRLNADNTVDTGFVPPVLNFFTGNFNLGRAFALAVQPDGKILVGGLFSSVSNTVTSVSIVKEALIRLNSNGSLDTNFQAVLPDGNPNNWSHSVSGINVLTNGQILISGSFTNVNGGFCGGIARLNASGTVDTNFVASLNDGSSSSMIVQPDGKILVCGYFINTVNGVARTSLARLNADGTLDNSFNAGLNGAASQILLQADGKIWVSGQFTQAGGQPRSYLARLNADGTADTNFVTTAYASTAVGFGPPICQQDDGQLIAAVIANPDPVPTRRFFNNPASRSLSVPDFTQVQWLRGGNSPQVSQAWFDLSTDNGVTWTNLGAAFRVTGGWRLTGLTLPARGIIRARGSMPFGYINGSGQSILSYSQAYNLFQPAMELQQPVGFDDYARRLTGPLTNGATRTFGPTAIGQPTNLVFQINSYGVVPLKLSAMSFTGPDAAMFSISQLPATTIAGPQGVSTFIITFTPTSTGTKTATLNIAANDPFSSALAINLTGLVYVGASSDPSFKVNIGNASSYADFTAIAIQPDGKKLVGGLFETLPGWNFAQGYLARLNADNTPDTNFAPQIKGFYGGVMTVAVQPDAKIVFGGCFTNVAGQSRLGIARVNGDGTLDSNFVANIVGTDVRQILLQPDGKILMCGSFTNVAGLTRNGIARLNTNGTVDTSFNIGAVVSAQDALSQGLFYVVGFNPPITTMALQPDGKILVGGRFTSLGGIAATNLARLNTNGTLDVSFQASGASNGLISLISVLPDNKILAAWVQPASSNTFNADAFFRLNTNGTRDLSFTSQTPGRSTFHPIMMCLQADGRVIFDASRTNSGTDNLLRMTTSGLVDPGFTNFVNVVTGYVNTVSLEASGQVLAGWADSFATGYWLGRLFNDTAIQKLYVFNTNRVRWLRGTSAPEASWVTFSLSTNSGATWTALGNGTRIPGGWELTGLTLPDTGILRGQARVISGVYNGSSSLHEQQSPYKISRTAITLQDTVRQLDNSFASGFYNPTGCTFTVLSSTNLALPMTNWTELTTPTEGPAGYYRFTQPPAPNEGQRYFRIKSP